MYDIITIVGLIILFYVQKSSQKPPESERLPSQQQSPASGATPHTTRDQPTTSAAYKKIHLGRQSLTHMCVCMHVCTCTYTHNVMIIVHKNINVLLIICMQMNYQH